ncbi:MAG: Trp family transcriptional regulator [Candidatus Gastranaerophilales bacterium]|nr:Trp family transcriptional regulator [Candidatus Gastranaerophilales bacterium]
MLENFSKSLAALKTAKEINEVLKGILTHSEIKDLSLRWQILIDLANNVPQRTISKELGVSLCKVTRGSKVLKENSSIKKILKNMKG